MRERARNLRSESEPHLNDRCLFQLRGKVLGGTRSINGMVYMRGQPQVLADTHRRTGILGHANDDWLVGKVWAGRLNSKIAPRGTFAFAHSRPPCASMIERQIASPMPMPPDLVV
jgi:choline dehydrogenase-like flavoprotein